VFFLEKYKTFGPGLLFAAMSIGVSHVVQSVKAGALFGLLLIPVVIIAHLIKYPFFKFAVQYSAHTKRSLLEGYHLLGKGYLRLFLVFILLSMSTIVAAVTFVGATILSNMLGGKIDVKVLYLVLFIGSALMLLKGHYQSLDKWIKVILVFMSLLTIYVVMYSLLFRGHMVEWQTITEWSGVNFDITSPLHIAFLVSLVGWLPCPLELSTWQSEWLLEKEKISKGAIKNSLLDFRIGYFISIVLSVLFLLLGSIYMHYSGIEPASKGTIFIQQFVQSYTQVIGKWSTPIISLVVFLTIFSSVMTLIDGYPRSILSSLKILGYDLNENKSYFWGVVALFLGSSAIIFLFTSHFTTLISVATTLSFFAIIVFSYINYKVIQTIAHEIGEDDKVILSKNMKLISVGSLILLGFFSFFALFYKWGFLILGLL